MRHPWYNPYRDPKTRPEDFYWVLVRRRFYARDKDNVEREMAGFTAIAHWYGGEWFLCGEADPVPERDIEIVADKVRDHINW